MERSKLEIVKIKFWPLALLSPLLGLLWVGMGWAGPTGDYDPVTGEPRCDSCHIKGLKPAIDYRNDPVCLRCHSTGLSDRFLAIDARYKGGPARPAEGRGVKAAQAKGTEEVKKGTRKKEASKAAQKAPKDMILIPAGEFTMGTNDWWPKSGPAHKRNVQAF